jgi:metal-responsive CopG/Arc/MetJ family transcriptional regulator
MFEDKRKFALWLHPETLEQVDASYKKDDCRSKSEFIEKAVRFYLSYLVAEDDSSLLPNAFLSSMKSIVSESDNRISRLLFKLAVEMAVMSNILATMDDVDDVTLSRLRGECVKAVKQINGAFTMEDAVKWQSD